MSLDLVAASSQYINNAAPSLVSTGYPFSVGMWINQRAGAAAQRICFLGDTGSTTNYLFLGMSPTNQGRIGARAGGSETSTSTSTSATFGAWNYVVARFISSTSRRLAMLYHSGLIEHANNTSSQAPTSLDTLRLGARATTSAAEYFDGQIAEFWLTDTDIQLDGAQLQTDLLHKLAYGGPFSIPHIAKDIIDYRSFRKDPISMEIGESYIGKSGIQTWTNVNGSTITAHPPLPYWHVRPNRILNRPYLYVDTAVTPPAAVEVLKWPFLLQGTR